MQTMEGGCHCGRVRFRVTADLERVTECNCSICAKKAFLHLIVPRNISSLSAARTSWRSTSSIPGPQSTRPANIAESTPFYVPRSDPDKIDVNVRCIDNIELGAVAPKPFDGRNWEFSMQQRGPWH